MFVRFLLSFLDVVALLHLFPHSPSFLPNPTCLGHPGRALSTTDDVCTPREECNQIFIDVSHHKGKIDWKKVVEENPNLWDKRKKMVAITKATEGDTFVDHRFEENFKGMKEAGIWTRGAYHYFVGGPGSSTAEAQVQNFIGTITKAQFDPDRDFIAVDVEKDRNRNKEGEVVRRDFTEKLVEVVKRLKEKVPAKLYIYSNWDTWDSFVDSGRDDFFAQFPLWVAHWSQTEPKKPRPWANKKPKMWQYSRNGTVNGIKSTEPVDMNVIQWDDQ